MTTTEADVKRLIEQNLPPDLRAAYATSRQRQENDAAHRADLERQRAESIAAAEKLAREWLTAATAFRAAYARCLEAQDSLERVTDAQATARRAAAFGHVVDVLGPVSVVGTPGLSLPGINSEALRELDVQIAGVKAAIDRK